MRSLGWSAVAVVFVSIGLGAVDAPQSTAALIRLLGDPSPAVRDEAEAKLLRLGRAASEELKKGLDAADPEVRRRCARLHPLSLRSDEDVRLDAFVDDESGKTAAPMEWRRFREAAGDDRSARKLFVEIFRRDRAFLEEFEKDPAKVGEQFQLLARRLHHKLFNPRNRAPVEVALPDFAMVFIAAPHAPVVLPGRQQFYLLHQCVGQGGQAKTYLLSSPALMRLLTSALARYVDDLVNVIEIARIATAIPLPEFCEKTFKPALWRLAKAARDGDGKGVGPLSLIMVRHLSWPDAGEDLRAALPRAAEAFAKHPDTSRYADAVQGDAFLNMPEVTEIIVKPAVVKFLSLVADRSRDQDASVDQMIFDVFHCAFQLGMQTEIDSILKPAVEKRIAMLIQEPIDPSKYSRACNLARRMLRPEPWVKLLVRAGRNVIADAIESTTPDFEKLKRVSAVGQEVLNLRLGDSRESLAPLGPSFLDKCAEAAIEAEDLENMALVARVAGNLGLQSSVRKLSRVGVDKAVQAALGKPLKSGSVESILNLVAGYHSKDGVKLAVQAVKQKDLDSAARGLAVVWLRTHGSKEQVPLFESLLNDKTICGELTFRDYAFRTELRDVALAMLISFDKGDPDDFGFSLGDFHRSIDIGSVPLKYLGFGDDVCREAAFKMWNERRKTKK